MMYILALIVAVGGMLCAQSKKTPARDRKYYSLLGGAASVIVALKSLEIGQGGAAAVFFLAAAASLMGMLIDYLKPTNPDA